MRTHARDAPIPRVDKRVPRIGSKSRDVEEVGTYLPRINADERGSKTKKSREGLISTSILAAPFSYSDPRVSAPISG